MWGGISISGLALPRVHANRAAYYAACANFKPHECDSAGSLALRCCRPEIITLELSSFLARYASVRGYLD